MINIHDIREALDSLAAEAGDGVPDSALWSLADDVANVFERYGLTVGDGEAERAEDEDRDASADRY